MSSGTLEDRWRPIVVEKFQTQMHSAHDRRGARGDAFDVPAAKPDAVRVAEGAIEPGCEEGVAHRWRRMGLEQRAGGGEREQLDHGPRSRLILHRFGEHDPHALDR